MSLVLRESLLKSEPARYSSPLLQPATPSRRDSFVQGPGCFPVSRGEGNFHSVLLRLSRRQQRPRPRRHGQTPSIFCIFCPAPGPLLEASCWFSQQCPEYWGQGLSPTDRVLSSQRSVSLSHFPPHPLWSILVKNPEREPDLQLSPKSGGQIKSPLKYYYKTNTPKNCLTQF